MAHHDHDDGTRALLHVALALATILGLLVAAVIGSMAFLAWLVR